MTIIIVIFIVRIKGNNSATETQRKPTIKSTDYADCTEMF